MQKLVGLAFLNGISINKLQQDHGLIYSIEPNISQSADYNNSKMNKLDSHQKPNGLPPSRLNSNSDQHTQTSAFFLNISQSYLDESQLMNSIHEDHQIYSQMHSQNGAAFKKGIFTIQQAEHGESESKSIFDNLNDDEALLLSPIEKSNRVQQSKSHAAIDFNRRQEYRQQNSQNSAGQSGERISQSHASSRLIANTSSNIFRQKESKKSMANSVPSSFNPHPNFFKKESKNGISSKNSIDSSMLVDMIPLDYLDDKESKADQNVVTIAPKISNNSLQSAHENQVEKETKQEQSIEYERTLDSIHLNRKAVPVQNNSQQFANGPLQINQEQESRADALDNIKRNNRQHSTERVNNYYPQRTIRPFDEITISFNKSNEVTMKFNQSNESNKKQSEHNILAQTSRRKQKKHLSLDYYSRGIQTSPLKQKTTSLEKRSAQIRRQQLDNRERIEEWVEFKADKYLNNPLPTQHDHLSFENELVPYIFLLFEPKPRNLTGQYLFRNGLVLNAMVKLITRPAGSPFIMNHLYKYLSDFYPIVKNKFMFDQQSKKARMNYERYLEQKYNERRNSEVEVDVVRRRSMKQSSVQSVFPLQKVDAEQQTRLPNLKLGSTVYNINQKIKVQRVIHAERESNIQQPKQRRQCQKQTTINTEARVNEPLLSDTAKLLKQDKTLLVLSDRLQKVESLSQLQEGSSKQNRTPSDNKPKGEGRQSIEQIESQICKDLIERYKLIRETRKSEAKTGLNNRQKIPEKLVPNRQKVSDVRPNTSQVLMKPVKKVQFLEDQVSICTPNATAQVKKSHNKTKKPPKRQFSADESQVESKSSKRVKSRSKK